MPLPGSVWGTGTWDADAWGLYTWSDAVEAEVPAQTGPLDAALRATARRLLGLEIAFPLAAFKRILETMGWTGTITYNSASAYDPATSSVSISTTTASVTGVVEAFTEREVGGLVELGDVKWIIPALGVTPPTARDTVTLGSDTYQVVRVTPVYANAQPAVFVLHMRR